MCWARPVCGRSFWSGVGNLGLALLSYRGFQKEGFEIIAAFDLAPGRKRGKNIATADLSAWTKWRQSSASETSKWR